MGETLRTRKKRKADAGVIPGSIKRAPISTPRHVSPSTLASVPITVFSRWWVVVLIYLATIWLKSHSSSIAFWTDTAMHIIGVPSSMRPLRNFDHDLDLSAILEVNMSSSDWAEVYARERHRRPIVLRDFLRHMPFSNTLEFPMKMEYFGCPLGMIHGCHGCICSTSCGRGHQMPHERRRDIYTT